MPRVFQPVDKTVEITIQGSMDGQQVENKFYCKGTSVITAAMCSALAAVADAWVAAELAALLPATWTYVRSIARDLTVAASFEAINTTHAGTAGALTGAPGANNVSFAIHRATGLSGVKAKSRIYFPGVSDDLRSGQNTMATANGNAIIEAYDDLRENFLADTSNTWSYGYVQRVIHGVKLAAGNFIEVFAHTLTDYILDSQRARLPGHGL